MCLFFSQLNPQFKIQSNFNHECQSMNNRAEEDVEFPVLCSDCLGPNPHLRMTKEPLGKECKVCSRPFTVFKWSLGSAVSFKSVSSGKLRKTELCQLCAKLKNVCQSCVLDLDYKLPYAERDAVLSTYNALPSSQVNTQYYVQNLANQSTAGQMLGYTRQDSAAKEVLKKLTASSANDPYAKRLSKKEREAKRKTRVCQYFLQGGCARGADCDYLYVFSFHIGPEGRTLKAQRAELQGPKGLVFFKKLTCTKKKDTSSRMM